MDATARDDWMRRTGPFYPLLVAFREQSDLPVAANLEPTDDDRSQAAPWVIAAAGGLAGVLAICAFVLTRLPLVPAIAGCVVVALGTYLGGGFAERGLLSGVRARLGWEVSGSLLAAVLVRLVLLLGIAPAAWPGALLASVVVSRTAWLVQKRPPGSPSGEGDALAAGLERWVWAVIASAAILTAVFAAGILGLGVVAMAVAIGWIGRARELDPRLVVGLTELLALLLIAMSAPARVSPLILPG